MRKNLTFFLGIIILLILAACNNVPAEEPDNTISEQPQIIGVVFGIEFRAEANQREAQPQLPC